MSMPGGRRNAAPILAPEIGTLSPSVITSSSRAREVGVKKRRLTTLSSASSRVAVEENVPCGGGRSIPIERRSVATKTSSSTLGKRCGRTRSVNETMPTGTSSNALRNSQRRSAGARVADRRAGPERASIERDVSITTKTSASDAHLACRRPLQPGLRGREPEQHGSENERGRRQASGQRARLR